MASSSSRLPGWRLEQHGPTVELQLTGDWIAGEHGIRGMQEVARIVDEADRKTLRLDASNLTRWDSALIAFLKMLPRTQPLQGEHASFRWTSQVFQTLHDECLPWRVQARLKPPAPRCRIVL